MDIVNAALRGIAKSHEEYTAWSGGCWLYEAPEYLITTNIVREIWRSFKQGHHYFLTLEEKVRNVCECADGEIGNVDIALWDPVPAGTQRSCRAIIEVKKQISGFEHIRDDIQRICDLLQRNRSIRFGAMAYCTAHAENINDQKMNQVLLNRVRKTECDAAKFVGSRNMGLICHRSDITRDCLENRAWIGGVIKVNAEAT